LDEEDNDSDSDSERVLFMEVEEVSEEGKFNLIAELINELGNRERKTSHSR